MYVNVLGTNLEQGGQVGNAFALQIYLYFMCTSVAKHARKRADAYSSCCSNGGGGGALVYDLVQIASCEGKMSGYWRAAPFLP